MAFPSAPPIFIVSVTFFAMAFPLSPAMKDSPNVVFPVLIWKGENASFLLLSIISPAPTFVENSESDLIAFVPEPIASVSSNAASCALSNTIL